MVASQIRTETNGHELVNQKRFDACGGVSQSPGPGNASPTLSPVAMENHDNSGIQRTCDQLLVELAELKREVVRNGRPELSSFVQFAELQERRVKALAAIQNGERDSFTLMIGHPVKFPADLSPEIIPSHLAELLKYIQAMRLMISQIEE